jgi:plastocyanin
MTDNFDRRTYLKTIGLTATALTLPLAGCSGSASEDTPSGGSDGDGGSGGSETTTTAGDGGSGDGEWAKTDTVDMTDELGFEPKQIEVSAGTTVTWKNVGSIGHTVTAYEDKIPEGATYFASGGFDSQQAAVDGYPDKGNIEAEGTYEHTFETKGTYEYYCIPHEMNGMVGKVKVV